MANHFLWLGGILGSISCENDDRGKTNKKKMSNMRSDLIKRLNIV
ncbi:uncharacterized protein METZ01_LOCUS441906 [marine metagenome]|uniref:Uncharacterized protein n=1 Tax=marine metagenome TaxID=408172 RepID=A0A382Z0L9_9ZZZZ